MRAPPPRRDSLSRLLGRIPIVRRWARRAPLIAHGPAGIARVGHRDYVGGRWEELGRLQFEFVCAQGLRPDQYFLDVACGSLRLGRLLVPYLDRGRYLGIDKEEQLLQAGRDELGPTLVVAKDPRLLTDGDFAFERFGVAPDFAWAQSLFTHLPAPHIERCLEKLRAVIAPRGVFFATFFAAAAPVENPAEPHDHDRFSYTRGELAALGAGAGWTATDLGDWRHPRGQMMMRFDPRG